MKTIIVSILVGCLMVIQACSQKTSPGMDFKPDIQEISKVDLLLSQMTLEEMIGQMNQFNGFWDATGPAPEGGDAKNKYELLKNGMVGSMLNVVGVENVRKMQELVVNESRLGIPLIFGFDVIHGHKTLSPIPLAEAASWDLEAIELSARVAAIEASARGLNWTFAPMVDISRDARWGRVMEGAGEDPFLGSLIGAARVKGFQGESLSANNTIAACAKHFAGYGFSESGRDYNAVDVGSSTLYNTILPPFKACIDEEVSTVMNSFNTLNGVPATGDKFLQREILKGKWKFEGFVVSDWGSVGEMIAHGHATDLKDAAIKAANAGSDMDMESSAYVKFLKEAVQEGKVDSMLILDAVKRILTIKDKLGLFDDPYKYCNPEREAKLLMSADHRAKALDMAKKSMVLLKNENDLLPLRKDQAGLLVIGDLAQEKNSPLGSWRIGSDDNTAVSVNEGLRDLGLEFEYSPGPKLTNKPTTFINELEVNTTDRSGFDEAVELAKNAETIIMVLGEHGFQSGEGRSRTNIDLPGFQQELLEAVQAVNKNIILVVMSGRPLILNWAEKNIPSILQAWQLGTESGNAIASVLTGDYNPSGKLPMCFPRSVGQIPIYYNQLSTGRPGPIPLVFWSHYGDEKNSPLYPFGYGLSYTTFDYSNLSVSNTYATNQEVKLSINIKNSGNRKGKEVVQLYLQDIAAMVARPMRELKGFELVELEAGESKTVEFTVTPEELGYFDNQGEYTVEPGEFNVFIGGDSNATMTEKFAISKL